MSLAPDRWLCSFPAVGHCQHWDSGDLLEEVALLSLGAACQVLVMLLAETPGLQAGFSVSARSISRSGSGRIS